MESGPPNCVNTTRGIGARGEPTTMEALQAGEIDIIVNTPHGVGSRVDGYEIRSAAVAQDPVHRRGAGARGSCGGNWSAALQAGELSVRTLQQHAADLAALRAAGG